MRNMPFLRMLSGIGTALCIIFVWGINGANARDDSFEYGSLMKFGGEVVSGFLIHEGAHAAAGRLTGTSMDWKSGDINQPMAFEEHSSSDDKGLAINSAGLLVQAGSACFRDVPDRILNGDFSLMLRQTWLMQLPSRSSLLMNGREEEIQGQLISLTNNW